jgi:murein DD-endopeptidase MepM/ murein hydrolase activator NlpD
VRGGTAATGVEISASPGSLVRASRSGRVAVAARQVSGWGKTVIIDHLDGHLTVYSGLGQILVSPGSSIRQGMPIGNTGSAALHFEIRYGSHLQNTLALLPTE